MARAAEPREAPTYNAVMRVAMLQASLPPAPQAGGVGHQVDLLARELSRRGEQVTVFAVDAPPADRPYQVEPVAVGPGRGRRVLSVGWRFSRLDLSGFDAVHAHGDDWLLGRQARVRTFYGSALMEARSATSALRRSAQACYYALEWPASVNRHSVAISEATRRCLPLVRSSVPCGYDPQVFHPGGARSADPSILFVAGTLRGRKRGHLLLDAFAEVRRAVPECRLTIVSHDRADLPGVTCLTGVAPRDLGELYRTHWLLCSTSAYEGFGIPYVEALASGLPVVTTANDGAREVLRHGELGVLCSPGALAGELVALLGDAGRRERMAAAGVHAAERYSIRLVAEEYLRRYTAAAAAGAGGPAVARRGRRSSQPSTSHGSGATA
jgi:phosphatidylinositol alpha-mannosyltransferase